MTKKKEQKPIEEMFPQLFGVFGGEYYLGTGIGEGWRQIVIDMCQRIQDSLSAEDLSLFSFIQIKSKFAKLTVYFRPSTGLTVSVIGGPDGFTNLDIPRAQARHKTDLSEPGRAEVEKIIKESAAKASTTCEICGEKGQLYRGGYWQVLCKKHAIEAGMEPH